MLPSRQLRILFSKIASTKKCLTNSSQNYVTQTVAAPNAEPKWQLIAAACITRPPVICPPLTPEEQRYKKLIEKVEEENSLKSGHELRILDDQIREHLSKEVGQLSLEEAAKQTGAEFEDAATAELKNYVFAPVITDADRTGDQTSLNRALDKSLVLVAHENLGSQQHWILPQTPWAPGETIRDTCDRVIEKNCGSEFKMKVLGNAPCGFYKYKYPKEVRKQGYVGAKVFFFSVHLLNSSLDFCKMTENPNHLWLTHSELADKVNKSYHKAVSQFLLWDD